MLTEHHWQDTDGACIAFARDGRRRALRECGFHREERGWAVEPLGERTT